MAPDLNLETLELKYSNHKTPDDGMCVMEAVSFLAGEKFSDAPQCACPVIAAFMRDWNDALLNPGRPEKQRRRAQELLKPLVAKLVGSRATKKVEAKRAFLAIDWYVRTFTPTWLELAGLPKAATALRELREVFDLASLNASLPPLDQARKEASAAGSAAWSAAESAAESAAWSAAESAAWSAAGSAAWSAAGSAAWSAAWSAAESAAESAARSAAWSAAEEALLPTVERLQLSALDLVNRMLAVTG